MADLGRRRERCTGSCLIVGGRSEVLRASSTRRGDRLSAGRPYEGRTQLGNRTSRCFVDAARVRTIGNVDGARRGLRMLGLGALRHRGRHRLGLSGRPPFLHARHTCRQLSIRVPSREPKPCQRGLLLSPVSSLSSLLLQARAHAALPASAPRLGHLADGVARQQVRIGEWLARERRRVRAREPLVDVRALVRVAVGCQHRVDH